MAIQIATTSGFLQVVDSNNMEAKNKALYIYEKDEK